MKLYLGRDCGTIGSLPEDEVGHAEHNEYGRLGARAGKFVGAELGRQKLLVPKLIRLRTVHGRLVAVDGVVCESGCRIYSFFAG